MWHFEVTALLVRDIAAPEDFEERVPFGAIATVNLLEPGRAFVRGALRREGGELRLQDFVEICQGLRDRFGVRVIESDRHGRLKTWTVDDVIVRAGRRGSPR